MANAVEHGFADRGNLELSVRCDPDALTIEVADAGTGFDYVNAPRSRPPSESLRGFGLFIMRELMDEVEYSHHGTCLRLVKRIQGVAAQPAVGREADISRTAAG